MSHNLLANLPCTSLIHRISSRRYKEKMRAINGVIGIKIIINNNSSLQNSPYNFTRNHWVLHKQCLIGCLHGERKILEGGSPGYCPSAIRFLYSVYMQRVLLGASTRKILAPYKLPSLERSQYLGQTRQTWWRVFHWLITAGHFVWRWHELIIVIIILKVSY